MSEPELVERVARAIEGDSMTDMIWSALPAAAKARMLDRARRAIEAVAEYARGRSVEEVYAALTGDQNERA